MNPKFLTKISEACLEEAVLTVLHNEKNGLGPKKISELTGIFRGLREKGANDAIVQTLLFKLEDKKYVEHIEVKYKNRKGEVKSRKVWVLTERGKSLRT